MHTKNVADARRGAVNVGSGLHRRSQQASGIVARSVPCFRGVASCRVEPGLATAAGGPAVCDPALHGPSGALRGWQCQAAHAGLAHCQAVLLGSLGPAGQAMLHSQSGPRVLLLRRLRLPLPLSERFCRCRGPSFCLRAIRGSSGVRLSFEEVRRAGLP